MIPYAIAVVKKIIKKMTAKNIRPRETTKKVILREAIKHQTQLIGMQTEDITFNHSLFNREGSNV